MAEEKRIFTEEHKRKLSEAHRGKKLSVEHRKNMSKALKGRRAWNKGVSEGEGNRWKGENVKYSGLHMWVRKHLGKAVECSVCGSRSYVDWANISHSYKRNLEDWKQMCRSCHLIYDDIASRRERDCYGRFI